MNDDFLKERLQRVIRRQQLAGLLWKLAVCWAVAAVVGGILIWAERATGWASPAALPLLAGLTATAVTALAMLHYARAPDLRWAAKKIEAAHPELQGLLLTAVQQTIEPGTEPSFLQHRILQEATARSVEHDWRKVVPAGRLAGAMALQIAALMLFIAVLTHVHVATVSGANTNEGWVSVDGLSITPGDTSVERGESLVVLARFGHTLPPSVNLIVREKGAARTVPLVKSLADPIFGGSVPEVTNDFTYRVDYGGRTTREFNVKVFEHPKLVRADADLTFPTYTKLPEKHIEDTRRVSAVEGTKLGFALVLNKPVASAKLIARDKAKTEIPLLVEAGKPAATLPPMAFTASQTYDVQLIDADGRANKPSPPFVIDVQPNRPPEIKLTTPRGDIRPSSLEEVAFDGTVFDDFGSPSYGIAYEVAGGAEKTIELGHDVSAKEKRAFNYTLKLEDVGAKPDDLVTWYVWADDIGPDGQVRRTKGDMYFAEIRQFDEIFRESQGMQSDDSQQQGGGEGGNATRKLAELEKDIISATWRLQRDGATPKYPGDAKVVAESQSQALAQAGEAKDNAHSVREQAMWTAATSQMEKALEKLRDAEKTTMPLAAAVTAEQAAYQALLKLQARETQVARSRSRGGRGGQGGAANQRQIDQLDLTQEQNRYETQRQARAPQTAQRQEQLQVMNRLQELARRQQDLNDRLKELQAALQEARSDQEKEDLKRRLKRLEEEQQQMLADADEVRQRMERPENQSSMSQERQQLDQTRQDLQKAAEAAASGSVPQALAAGTRAQRALQQMRDDLRKENSSQFADDLRDMRSEARDLARQQDELSKEIDALGSSQQHKSLGDAGDQSKLQEQLAQQREKMNQIVDKAKQISEQAENSEPLLSRQLYDSVRKLNTDDADTLKQTKQELLNSGQMTRDLLDRLDKAGDKEDAGKALDLMTELLKDGNNQLARQAAQRARSETDELRRGVERAADSVLGDDTEQLKLAQSELDSLADQLRKEIAQGQGKPGDPKQTGEGKQTGSRPGDQQSAAGSDLAQRLEEARNQLKALSEHPERVAEIRDLQRRVAQLEDLQRKAAGAQSPGQTGGVANNEQPKDGQSSESSGGQQPGDAKDSKSGGGQAGGNAQANNANQPNGGTPGQAGDRRQLADANTANSAQGGGGGGRTGFDINNILNGPENTVGGAADGGYIGGAWSGGPLTSANFGQWTERLRDVETLLDSPELRAAIAAARERARLMRSDYAAKHDKPDWAVVQAQILKPLVEVRERVAEELARRDPNDVLAPIDRDPVPNRFADSVRRYYEELGKDKLDGK